MFLKCIKIPSNDRFVSSDQNATNGSRFGIHMSKLCMNIPYHIGTCNTKMRLSQLLSDRQIWYQRKGFDAYMPNLDEKRGLDQGFLHEFPPPILEPSNPPSSLK